MRGIANAFGKDVLWDGATSSVYLGESNSIISPTDNTTFSWEWGSSWEITVNSIEAVDRVERNSYYYDAGEGNKYIVANISAKNIGKRAYPFLERVGAIRIYYDDTYEYTSIPLSGYFNLVWRAHPEDLHDRSITPLETATGIIAFRIPDEIADKPLVLRFGAFQGDDFKENGRFDYNFKIQN